MPHTFTRQALYDLVWSEPMRNLSAKYSISDRGLAKACAAANIPAPERGYWNKLQAGKKVFKKPLPHRGLGQSDEVTIGAKPGAYYRESETDLLNEPIPPTPVFAKDMEAIRAQVTAMVGKAPSPKKKLDQSHPQIARLLQADEVRRQKQLASRYPSSWDAPKFDTPFEARRLKILNALFACLEFCGTKPSISGKESRDLSVVIGDTHVSFSLDAAGSDKLTERERMGYAFQARDARDKMRLSLNHWRSPQEKALSWQDLDGDRIENHLREIVMELIVRGEQSYRDSLIRHRERRIERQAQLQEQERKRKAEKERIAKERLAKLERLRVDHLLKQADAMRQAVQIRSYVAAIQETNKTAPQPMSDEELNSWTQWALAQADRIDPVISGAYKTRPPEPEE